jgi:hypothetical protein
MIVFSHFFSLVDLGDENDRNLKMPTERTAEEVTPGGTQTVQQATTQRAEEPAKVNKTTKGNGNANSEGQTHVNGGRHHMKTAAEKCKYYMFCITY